MCVWGQAERMRVQMMCLIPLMLCIFAFRAGIVGMYWARIIETYVHVMLTMVLLTDTWLSRTDHGDFLCEGGTTPVRKFVAIFRLLMHLL
jgi:hypothetical protein